MGIQSYSKATVGAPYTNMPIKKTKASKLEKIASNSNGCLAIHCLWLGGCADSLLNATRKVGSHQSLECLFSWRARPCDVECCSSSTSIHPSTSVDAVPAVRLDRRAYRNMWACRKQSVHRNTCAHPSLVSRCASITPQHLVYVSSLPCGPCSIKSDDWLSVYKKKSHFCFQPGHYFRRILIDSSLCKYGFFFF